jgi:hypothetical protein
MNTFPTSLTLSHVTTYPFDRRSQPVAPTEKSWTCSREISRMLNAAVVSRKFCQLLLADPLLAMRSGYNGETFQLSADEANLLSSIRATTLPDFATQLLMAGNKGLTQFTPEPQETEEAEPLSTRNGRLNERVVQSRRFAEVSL